MAFKTQLISQAVLQISGVDAFKFLQGQLTCHLDEINQQQSRLAAHCNPQGRIISLFRLLLIGESYYLILPKTLLPLAIAALKKYAMFFKVEIQEVTDKLFCYTADEDTVRKNFAALPEEINAVVCENKNYIVKLADDFYLILSDSSTLFPLLDDHDNAWRNKHIAAGLPLIYPDTSGAFLPHEINLPYLQAVSFNKGCYTGQEIIARMHYRGKTKKRMQRFTVLTNKKPQPAQDIYDESNVAGTIIDSALTNQNQYELLALLDKNSVNVFLDKDKTETLTLLPLPYTIDE